MRFWQAFVATIAAGLCLCIVEKLPAQEPAEATPPAVSEARVRVAVVPGPVSLYRPEEWNTVRLWVNNPRDEPAVVQSSSYFDGEPMLQYGRRSWLPARSKLETFHPVRVPRINDPKQQLVDMRTMLLESESAGERLVAGTLGELQRDNSLRLAARGPLTGILSPPNKEFVPDVELHTMSANDLVLPGRFDRGFGPNSVYLIDRQFPVHEVALDALDQLVIADDRILEDPTAVMTIRRWLYGGGRLWVMLDRVNIRVLELLLGDAFAGQEVDRVSLTHVELNADPLEGGLVFTADLDHPVKLVRVLASGVEVSLTIDGWPAAFWQQCGRGRLLVTTLGAAGWLTERDRNGPPPKEGGDWPKFVRNGAYEILASQFFDARIKSPLTDEVAEPRVAELVGYSVPARGLIVGWLTLFSTCLIGVAFVLARRDRLERFAGWGPIAAIAAASVLVILGSRTRAAIPPMTTLLQYVQVIPGTDDVRINGTAAVFTPSAVPSEFAGDFGGWILPELAGTEGSARRVIWTDENRWQWENLTQSPGLRTAEFSESFALDKPLHVSATFDEQGVVGQLSLPEGFEAADAVLATPSGRVGVDVDQGGEFRASSNRLLTSKEFVAAGVLSDEQLRRSQTLASIMAQGFPAEPTLLFWTKPWPSGLRFSENNPVSGSALVSVPLSFSRPATGSSLIIPAPLLPYREAGGPSGEKPSGFYDFRKREWTAKHRPATAWLQFSVPRTLLPLKSLSARVVVQVDGPVGKLELSGMKDGTTVPLHAWLDPVGTLVHEITDPTCLALNADGKFTLKVSAGDPDRPELTSLTTDGVEHVSYWQIESLSLELRARAVDEQ